MNSFFAKHFSTFNCHVWSVKYAWILNKKDQNKKKCWIIRLIQDSRSLVNVFSILVSTESLVHFFYLSIVCKLCIFFRHNRISGKQSFSSAIYGKFNSSCFTYSDFFLVCKFCLSDLQIMSLNSNHLRFIGNVDIGGF